MQRQPCTGALAAALLLATCARQPDASPTSGPPAQIAVALPRPDAAVSGIEPPERAPPPSEREKDIAWAREQWPEETRELTFDSLAPELVAWVAPGGELSAFLTAGELRCARVVLRREADAEDSLRGAIITHEGEVDGGLERSYRSASLGHWLHLESGGGTETFDGQGWVQTSGWGMGDGGTTFHVLSHVDDQIARWRGAAVRLTAECAGPFELLPCEGGGERPCDTCRHVALRVTEHRPDSMGAYGFGRRLGHPRATCSEPCPKLGNPAIDRLRRSRAFDDAWRPLAADDQPDVVPTLYRSEARCRRQ